MLSAARLQIRSKFVQNRGLDPEAAVAAVRAAEEVADVLRHNIVQGEKVGQDTYSELSVDLRLLVHLDVDKFRAQDTQGH